MTARLQDQDFTYWFLSEAFGWDVVLQLVWRFDDAVPDADVTAMAMGLARGALHRRIVRPSIPVARPGWVRSDRAPAVRLDDERVTPDEVLDWATRDLETVDLDAEEGRCWALRATRTTTGGSALSLTCLHLVADGRAMTAAAVAAVVDAAGVRDDMGCAPTGLAALVGDVGDAARQVAGAAAGVARTAAAVVSDLRSPDSGAARPASVTPRTPAHTRAPRARPSWATVTVPLTEWDAVARRHGGTRNSLFVAVLAGALIATGYADDGLPVKVGIPMSLRRGDDDQRSNATGGVSISLAERVVPGSDLGGVRALCRDAFAALSAGRRPAMIHLQPLLQVLPLSVVTSVVTGGGSGMPDVVASNLGSFDGLLRVGGRTATDVAFRGTAHHVDPAGPQRFGEGVQSWYLETDGAATFAVAGFDETRVGSAQALTAALSAELTGWDVPHEFW
ncbi:MULTISPECIES: hypothetical protein [Nocardiaceae]|uniref:Condensation domain-containing protein n=1 Tax=Rhodococcoides corynebacterioides TaxID=53972 RepID=A0ABS2KQN0_9NOCA|nr:MULTISPECIES: hypothetical protein [Rhodococcus]MBM7414259.1 hypothetical protein [Rhodococcus corynebacterioides]MBP1116722.1 hypothetical protein [Rhodococcus sp. PvP016]